MQKKLQIIQIYVAFFPFIAEHFLTRIILWE